MSHSHTVRRRVVVVFVLTALLIAGVPITTGQESGTVTLGFVAYEGNPIIARGAEGEWDAFVGMPRVVYHDGLFHMFYVGSEKAYDLAITHIGYASSEDGLNWTKHEGNPVLSLDPSVAANGVGPVAVLVEDSTWVMLLPPRLRPGFSSSFFVQRATASDPTGPWEIEDGILFERGSGRDWDEDSLYLDSIVRTENGYHVYYGTFPNFGLVTSPDGTTWTKYNDPQTDQSIYRNSDPVFVPGESGAWDDSHVYSGTVWLGDNGWEMIYHAGPVNPVLGASSYGLGYATSEDGITWTRHGDLPFYTLGPDHVPSWPNLVVVNDTYYLYHQIAVFGVGENEIGVATGTITRN